MPAKKINWKKVWSEYDSWWLGQEPTRCKTCNRLDYDYPEWEDQQKAIQRLVSGEVLPKKRRGK